MTDNALKKVSTEEELKEFMSCFALTTRLLGPSLILAVVLLVIAFGFLILIDMRYKLQGVVLVTSSFAVPLIMCLSSRPYCLCKPCPDLLPLQFSL